MPALSAKWGEGRVKELLDGVSTWICTGSGYETARAFCNLVGDVEGVQKSWNTTTSRPVTWGRSWTPKLFQAGNSTHSESTSSSYPQGETYSLHT